MLRVFIASVSEQVITTGIFESSAMLAREFILNSVKAARTSETISKLYSSW